ncbi:MAG: transglutaminase-like cysteine peptidase [Hahellaceae bacterium]|nr:transglutaminase-like cysteine peptidase [Hahellaceae bacterium]MCP5212969.1 transglutaminase-like cysteine peptidase [Hahellaceae bacterium]
MSSIYLLLNQYLRSFLLLVMLIAPVVAAIEFSDELLAYAEKKFGIEAKNRLLNWQALTNSLTNETELEKVTRINAFFNQTRFVSDMKHWGKEDYWATPVEMLITNGGDCEDYSIAKYFSLKSAGVADEKMRITYVKALRLNQAHMVLAYYPEPDADPLILDNLNKELKPASERDDLAPVYSFNGTGLWLSRLRGQGKRIGEASKLERWVDVNTRLLNELK